MNNLSDSFSCEYKDDYIEIVHPSIPLFDEFKKPKLNCFMELGYNVDNSWTEEMLDFYKNWNILLNYQKINFYYGDEESISLLESSIKKSLIQRAKFISFNNLGFINCCLMKWEVNSKFLLMFTNNDTISNINSDLPTSNLLFNDYPYTLNGDSSDWNNFKINNHWQDSDKPLFDIVKKVLK